MAENSPLRNDISFEVQSSNARVTEELTGDFDESQRFFVPSIYFGDDNYLWRYVSSYHSSIRYTYKVSLILPSQIIIVHFNSSKQQEKLFLQF